jgi:hypothetical protein
MSFLDAKNYASALVKKAVHSDVEQNTIPYFAKIGSLLKISPAIFVRASIDSAFVSGPSPSEDRVVAISHTVLDEGNRHTYRLFLATEKTNEVTKFVQIYCDTKHQPIEAAYYSLLTRFIPEDMEEQDLYMGTNGSGVGESTYILSKENAENCSVDPNSIASALNGSDSIRYERDDNLSASFVPPYKTKEVRIDDNEGLTGLTQDCFSMNYVRTLPSTRAESLLITLNVVTSCDGDPNSRSIWVNYYAGVGISLNDLTIQ